MAIRTVVLPLDFSAGAGRAVRPAGAVAARFGARVLPVSSRFGWGDRDPTAALAALTAAIGALADPPRVVDRFAPNAIGEITRTTPGSLVCMATHGREGLARLAGSVAEEVLRQVGAPALLVGPASDADPTAGTGPVLVCVDGSRVSHAIWPTAAEWLRTTRQAARLVRVVRRAEPAEAIGAALADLAAERCTGPLGRVSWAVLRGDDAAAAIVDRARREHVPLIAMATHGRTGLDRVIVGSVTTRVVRDAPCPVLTVRPRELDAGPSRPAVVATQE